MLPLCSRIPSLVILGGWESIQVLGFNWGNAEKSGIPEGALRRWLPARCPACPSASHCLGWVEGRQRNAVASCFCSGNAAVRVSNTIGLSARNCSAEARGGPRRTGHRPAMSAHVHRCQNGAEKHPENNRNFHLWCFIT